MRREQAYYPIPAGTVGRRCRGARCGATMYWVDSPHRVGKMIAVSCPPDDPDCQPPTVEYSGVGVNHHPECVDLAQFDRHPEDAAVHHAG